MNEQEIEEWRKRINEMTHEEMAYLWRFAPLGHPSFRSDLPLHVEFVERFKRLGGMTPQISKRIGLNHD